MNIKSKNKVTAILLFFMLLVCSAIIAFAQTPDKLAGIWVNAQGTRQAELYRQESLYRGKITWVSADEEKVKVGDIIFKDLKWDGKRFTGVAVTPMQGDVPCTIQFENDRKIKITVSKGFMSRSVYWSRVK